MNKKLILFIILDVVITAAVLAYVAPKAWEFVKAEIVDVAKQIKTPAK